MNGVFILRTVFIIVLTAGSLHLFSQENVSNINLERIPQKKVRRFIAEKKRDRELRLEDIRSTFRRQEDDTTGYCTLNKCYLFRENLASVWDSYLNNDMAKLWSGNMVSFGVSVSRSTRMVSYFNENFVRAEPGQILFLNLRLFKGIYNLATAFEITEIDPIKKIIVFSYVEGGKSTGAQIISFRATDEGYTAIEHKTYFKSKSHFRDKRLYPFFHLKLIDEFHFNVSKTRTENEVKQ
jgi:hypothetical protein